MVIVGIHQIDSDFLKAIEKLNERKDVIIVHENLTNLKGHGILNIDSCVTLLDGHTSKTYLPDIIITLGNQIVSKKIKQFLNKKAKVHWDVPIRDGWRTQRDMFNALDLIDPVNEKEFLELILEIPETMPSTFKKDWLALSKRAEEKSKQYLDRIPFCDLKVFESVVKSYPTNTNIQYGNSSPIRYSNFFKHDASISVSANRGTSGIDGCLSTAAGAAHVNKRMTICVLGDISFFYDSNALWNNYLLPDLRIIVINNGGGNIFRMIDGPTGIKDFEKFFETKHNLSAKHLASMYELPYYICDSQKGLNEILKTFYKPSAKPKILEVKTDGVLSAKVYKEYFEFLKRK
jgi:2-succinyl-5-enolpyruvyl-6-hydroxy-3-cyclohexene-1-carboxylate synthase